MKINRLEFWSQAMQLTEPYTIAYETITTTTNVFLQIITDGKLVGCGCAAPDPSVTGETVAMVLEQLQGTVTPLLTGANPLRRGVLTAELETPLAKFPATLAAVEMALLDLQGKYARLPVWQLLGGFRDSFPTSVTIGILPAAETLEAAQAWVRRGFHHLKIKGGLDVVADLARLTRLHDTFGTKIEFRFDANQGYSLEAGLEFVHLCQALHLAFIEQPTPANRFDWLGEINRQRQLPVMADESLLTLADAWELARQQAVTALNLKLMKVGGINHARQILALARAANLQVMVGCMDEAALGIAAGLHFALAEPGIQYVDLDGHLGLAGDISAAAIQMHGETLFPVDQPGLGLEYLI
ncbi:dipeptide epimerase [candidate division KSB1 bacterium]|nr:dipeptide epimerase [candidate division KSB1 bacterium]